MELPSSPSRTATRVCSERLPFPCGSRAQLRWSLVGLHCALSTGLCPPHDRRKLADMRSNLSGSSLGECTTAPVHWNPRKLWRIHAPFSPVSYIPVFEESNNRMSLSLTLPVLIFQKLVDVERSLWKTHFACGRKRQFPLGLHRPLEKGDSFWPQAGYGPECDFYSHPRRKSHRC